MRPAIALTLILAACLAAGCTSRDPFITAKPDLPAEERAALLELRRGFDRLEPGMTGAQVIALVGYPSRISSCNTSWAYIHGHRGVFGLDMKDHHEPEQQVLVEISEWYDPYPDNTPVAPEDMFPDEPPEDGSRARRSN